MVDTYKHKGMREKLIRILMDKGLEDPAVIEAMRAVPRHAFVEGAFAEAAYEDRSLPIGDSQTISQPLTVAFQTAMLKLKKGMKTLEIGTGSGYQAAVLCAMGAKVFSVERIAAHHRRAQRVLNDLELRVRLKRGDGSAGWQSYAPFDRILVTAASPGIPETLKKQLSIGGKLVIPVGERERQQMAVVTRQAQNEWEIDWRGWFQFVPLIGRHGWKADPDR
ncbi:MAG: protein-L-isoaspartate(D-aspartate) O-methyltransferase [Bacteroidota bacterium]